MSLRILRLKHLFESCRTGVWGEEPGESGGREAICVRAADFDGESGRLKPGPRTRRALDPEILRRHELRPGDLILEKSGGGDQQAVGRAALFEGEAAEGPCVVSNHLARCRPAPGTDPAFLLRLLAAIRAGGGMEPHVKRSAGIRNLDLASLLDLRVALPPLAAQREAARRIAEEAARGEALAAQKRALLALLAEKRRGLILRLCAEGTDPAAPLRPSGLDWPPAIPAHWEILPLRRRFSVSYGVAGEIDRGLEQGARLISPADLDREGGLRLGPPAWTPPPDPRFLLKPGDLLFNWRSGSLDHLGKTARFAPQGEAAEGWTHVSFLLRIRAKTPEADPDFLFWRLNALREAGIFRSARTGVNGAFSLPELEALPLAGPPDPREQAELARRLEAAVARLDAARAALRAALALLEARRTSGLAARLAESGARFDLPPP